MKIERFDFRKKIYYDDRLEYIHWSGTSIEFTSLDIKDSKIIVPLQIINEIERDIIYLQKECIENNILEDNNSEQKQIEIDKESRKWKPYDYLNLNLTSEVKNDIVEEKKKNVYKISLENNCQILNIHKKLMSKLKKLSDSDSEMLMSKLCINSYDWSNFKSFEEKISNLIKKNELLDLIKLSDIDFS